MDPTTNSLYESYLSVYKDLIKIDFQAISERKTRLLLPIIPYDIFAKICVDAKDIFENESIVLQLYPPIIVVGDVHGHILDLLRIFHEKGLVPETKYLFLGDYVDRGSFSIETISLLFLLKILYPDSIYLIRGNHEFSEVCDHDTLLKECSSLYNSRDIYETITETFSYLPLAATIGNYALCVHGGIGRSFCFVNQLRSLKRPIRDFSNPIVEQLLWSDPSNEIEYFGDSPRGLGQLFGFNAISSFLEQEDFSILIRGHQCMNLGAEMQCKNKVLTVFSCSNYCGVINNLAAIVLIPDFHRYIKFQYPLLSFINREDALFSQIDLFLKQKRPKTANKRKPGSLNDHYQKQNIGINSINDNNNINSNNNKLRKVTATASAKSFSPPHYNQVRCQTPTIKSRKLLDTISVQNKPKPLIPRSSDLIRRSNTVTAPRDHH